MRPLCTALCQMCIRRFKLHNQSSQALCQRIVQIAGHTLAFIGECQLLHLNMRFFEITQESLNPQSFLHLLKEQ
ncbi:hypothetical protein D3C87_2074030 [compost metagenome]